MRGTNFFLCDCFFLPGLAIQKALHLQKKSDVDYALRGVKFNFGSVSTRAIFGIFGFSKLIPLGKLFQILIFVLCFAKLI